MIVPIAVGLACGLVAGLINGALIAYTRIPPFIATLGMMVTARGLAKWCVEGRADLVPDRGLSPRIGKGMMPVLIFLAWRSCSTWSLRYTVYGKHTYAIGSNEAAARMSAASTSSGTRCWSTSSPAMLAALAGIVLSSKNLTAQAGHGRDVRARRHRDGGDRRRHRSRAAAARSSAPCSAR